MKINQREKYLLALTGCVLIAIVYYQFVYVSQIEKIAQQEVELQDMQIRYEEVMQNIATLEERQEKIKGLSARINDITYDYYPELIQEKLILELNEFIQESDLNATLTFSQLSASAVESLNAPGAKIPQSSLKPYVDRYEELINGEDATLEEDVDPSEELEDLLLSLVTAQVLNVGVTFTGAYENVKAFIDEIQTYRYNVVMTDLALSPQTKSDVAGSMTLEFYGIPKLDDQDQEYLAWTLDGDYGKEYPFSTGAATGAYSDDINELLELVVRVNDFLMVARSNTSDLPNVTVGQANDETLESYVYSDKEKEEVEIRLLEEDGKYYFYYSTSEETYPESVAKAQAFIPKQETINLQILSEKRVNDADNTSVTVTIFNETDLTVDVQVKNDDVKNPRVSVKTEGNAVNVTQK